ncbi:large ribosomal subunit protein bL20-like [Styela clava]
MFLTCIQMLRQPRTYPLSRWYKHEKLKEQAKHYFYKSLRVRTGLMSILLRKSLKKQYFARRNKDTVAGILRNNRLAAATSEHNVTPHMFKSGLGHCKIILSNKLLTNLAIYEPRTFKGLIETAQRANIEKLRERHEELPDRRLTAHRPRPKLTTGIH